MSGYILAGVDPDSIAPAAVTSQAVTGSGTSTLTLGWTASTAADTTGVVIRRALGRSAPASITDGAFVADVLVPGSGLTDTGLNPATTYSYALFAHDGSDNTAAGASLTGTTTTSPPVWAWGNGTSGERGNGTAGSSAVPAPVSGLSTITAIAGGAANGFALDADGTVWSWGDGSDGRLGNGGLASSPVPVRVSGVRATAIAAGSDGYALRGDGTVWAWGDGSLGALGNGNIKSSSVPVQVSGLTAVRSIAAGFGTGYAVRSDGTGWAWGDGSAGQLAAGDITSSKVPVRISGLRTITAIAAGSATVYALGQ